MNPEEFLTKQYEVALKELGSSDSIQCELAEDCKNEAALILEKSEASKAVLTVTLTSLVYKTLHTDQDIRRHQTSIPNGYSGRTFDSKYITPFLKKHQFPAMAESGWLTRSLEQKVIYDMSYSGAIRPPELKNAFLSIIEKIEENNANELLIQFFLQGLILKRNAQRIELAKPASLPIERIVHILDEHFQSSYMADGASRLPVLALYAAYQCLMKELRRFEKKTILSLESHTSADTRSGRIGDIDIEDEDGSSFEAVEVKYGIPINRQLIEDAYEKFKTTQVRRYYLLSTADIAEGELGEIKEAIDKIKNIHGCHVIANGLVSSLKYYLRLLSDTSDFISNYVDLIELDTAIKFEHKKQWNTVVANM